METAKHFDLRSETRDATIERLKKDIFDLLEEPLSALITTAMQTKKTQSVCCTIALKNVKGEWTSNVHAKASYDYGKTTREAKEVGGQLTLMGVIFE